MALNIKNPEADRLARELAAIKRIQDRVARLPRLDRRTDEAIIAYDETGVPN